MTTQKFSTLVLSLALSMTSLPLFAQDAAQQPSQTPATQSTDASAQQAQSFSGKIVKSKGSLALQDAASGTTYKLDSEDQAKQYVGKDVKVTGTVDPATSTIHVTNIEPSTSSK
jgi:lipopolysaccharide export system protein LptA